MGISDIPFRTTICTERRHGAYTGHECRQLWVGGKSGAGNFSCALLFERTDFASQNVSWLLKMFAGSHAPSGGSPPCLCGAMEGSWTRSEHRHAGARVLYTLHPLSTDAASQNRQLPTRRYTMQWGWQVIPSKPHGSGYKHRSDATIAALCTMCTFNPRTVSYTVFQLDLASFTSTYDPNGRHPGCG